MTMTPFSIDNNRLSPTELINRGGDFFNRLIGYHPGIILIGLWLADVANIQHRNLGSLFLGSLCSPILIWVQ